MYVFKKIHLKCQPQPRIPELYTLAWLGVRKSPHRVNPQGYQARKHRHSGKLQGKFESGDPITQVTTENSGYQWLG